MSAFWQYFSFPQARWTALFDGSRPDASRRLVASAYWESVEGAVPDPEADPAGYLDAVYQQAPSALRDLAGRLSTRGFDYAGATPAEARRLDSMVVGFFCPEGLEDVLGYRIEGTDGLASRAVDELLARSRPQRRGGLFGLGARVQPGHPVTLAPFLASGRRIGTATPPYIEDRYFLFDPGEVPVVLAEVDALLALDRPWATDDFRLAVLREVRAALAAAAARGDCLAGRYT